MDGDKSAFINKLDELILLFEKLKNKATKDGIILKDDPLYANFEMLANNYRLIKHNLPEELLQEISEPIKEIITQMVDQLKREMGTSVENDESESIKDELSEIDQLLKKNDLSEDEINHLLDKRSGLN